MPAPIVFLLLLSALCFLAAALDYQHPRTIAMGLFFMTLYFMFGGAR